MAAYEAIQGGNIQLNCNLTKFSPEDAIQLVFWYKGESNKPIYSVDARNPSKQRHFNYFALKMAKSNLSTEKTSYKRVFADTTQDEEFAQLRRLADRLSLVSNYSLRIDRLSKEDDGMYRCRVDFRYARTLNTMMKLHVIGMFIILKIV